MLWIKLVLLIQSGLILVRPMPIVNPPPAWERLYHEVEECMGLTGDWENLRLVSADTLTVIGTRSLPWDMRPYTVWGRVDGNINTIYLQRKFAGHPKLQRHEFAHMILYLNGQRSSNHRHSLWLKCGAPDWWELGGKTLSWDSVK